MSADLLRHNPGHVQRPGPRPTPSPHSQPARVRAPSSAPLSVRPSSASNSDSGSTSSAGSASNHRNPQLLDTYHSFAMQLFNNPGPNAPGNGHDSENLFLSAARDGDYERVENFLRRRSHEIVNIDVKEKRTGNTPILWAVKNSHLKIVQLLLKYGADITIRNFDNETTLEVAKPSIRSVLLKSVERAGCSPRHLLQAAWQGNIEVVQRLLNESRVLDINCRNTDGFTPLLLVTRDVDLFEQIGAAMDNYNPHEVVRELVLHRADLTTQDSEGRTPLHFVAASKAKVSEEIALILMRDRSALDARDRRSSAPVHSASQSGQVEILVALLDSGADVNARGFAGATPLHVSAYSGQLQTATKLLDHGADVTLVDDRGNTPVDVAKTKKLKHTLRDAWTEATQSKCDVVLTPVKPPSRMAADGRSGQPTTDDRMNQEATGNTPRLGSAKCTPENRIIRKMTEAHKAVLAEEQMLRDIDSGCFTPSNSPRRLGLPRASSRVGPSPGKIPIPPKTPRVLDHSPNTSPTTSPAKQTKTPRFGGRPRTQTVPGGDNTSQLKNQRARAHAKVTQRNSDPTTLKSTTSNPQVPITVVELDWDESLRDMRFQRLISGPVGPYLRRSRSHEGSEVTVRNPTPPSERRPSGDYRRGSNPSVHDLAGVCIDYMRKGLKYPKSISSSPSSLDDESSIITPRLSFRANLQSQPLNPEHVQLHLQTPSPMLDHIQLTSPGLRNAIPVSPSLYSENIQETIFEFDDEEEENGHPKPQAWCQGSHQPLARTRSILDHSKPFSIENTRVQNDANKEPSTDSGKGSRTTNSIASSPSTLSTPSPLAPGTDMQTKYPVTNRFGVNMTPSATVVRESVKTKVCRTPAIQKSATTAKIYTKLATEIAINPAKTAVVENSEALVETPKSHLLAPKTCETNRTSPKTSNLNRSNSSGSSSGGSGLTKLKSSRQAHVRSKSGGLNSERLDLESESKRTNHERLSSGCTRAAKETKNSQVNNGLNSGIVVASSANSGDSENLKHKTAVAGQPQKGHSSSVKTTKKAETINKVEIEKKNIQGSNSAKLKNTNSKSSTNTRNNQTFSKTANEEKGIHETVVEKINDIANTSSGNGENVESNFVDKCESAGTKLLFRRLNDQGSLKKEAHATPPKLQKLDPSSVSKSAFNGPQKSTPQVSVGTEKSPDKFKDWDKSHGEKVALETFKPSRKSDTLSTSSEMPKVSPRPGLSQGSKSPAVSIDRPSPRIQTSKGEPSLSKSFGSGSTPTKTELRNMARRAKQKEISQKLNAKQRCSSDEGVSLDLDEQDEKSRTSEELLQNQRDGQERGRHTTNGKKTTQKSDKGVSGSNASVSKTDSLESFEDVYEEVVFSSLEEKGQNEGKEKMGLSQEIVKVQIKEVDMLKEAKLSSKTKKIVRKSGGRIIPALKAKPGKQQRDSEGKAGGVSKAAVTAFAMQLDAQSQKSFGKPDGVSSDTKEKNRESSTPRSRNIPNLKNSRLQWTKFRSPEVSPRSVSSPEMPHDPRIIKDHTPIIQDVTEWMQMMPLHPEPTPIPWKPREKVSSTSSCPSGPTYKFSLHVKTRRRVASNKEPPRRTSLKGNVRKITIMGQTPQKAKGRPGSGAKQRQKSNKKPELDAVSTQKKGKPKVPAKPKSKITGKQNGLHLLSESNSTTKAFVTGQGWHIQTQKNETSDVIIHDRSVLDNTPDPFDAEKFGSPKLSPHNTLMLSELCKIHPLSPSVINNITNIISPLEADAPHFIPDTMGTIKEFSDSLKSASSLETDPQSRGSQAKNSARRKFAFDKENLDRLTDDSQSQDDGSDDSEEIPRENCGNSSQDVLPPEVKSEDENLKESIHITEQAATLPPTNNNQNHLSGIDTDTETSENRKLNDTPRFIASGSSGNMTDRSDASFVANEDVSSYETNPEFLKVFRLHGSSSPNMSPRSAMFRSETSKEENKQEASSEMSAGRNPGSDITSEAVVHKPPLPLGVNTVISELTRVPRGSIRRRNSEPPEKSLKEQPSQETANLDQAFYVKNSWEENSEVGNAGFVDAQKSNIRTNWRKYGHVEDMISPLKSRLPDKNFSPPTSSKESSTTRKGHSVPEFVHPEESQQNKQGQNKPRTSHEKLLDEISAEDPQRKISAYSSGSEVFFDEPAAENDDNSDDDDDATVHDDEQKLTEHVQNMSMSAIQEFNTLLSQMGDLKFGFPSPTGNSTSRDGSAASGFVAGVDRDVCDWLNESLTTSEASEATRTLSVMSSEMQTTQSSGLSSERSHSSSTNFSDSEGGLLHWKKGNVLGRGAFGVVYCGLTNTGQLIAVKQVELSDKDNKHKSRQQYEKLQEEVELLKTLRHRNIVGFLGVSLEGSTVNIFMQYIPGGSIASLLARFGALEEPVFCRYTKQILQGTEYLHSKNVIHRDIKGANIMLMSNGVIKLIDFGCAKRLCINMSQSQSLLKSMRGTPYWMAPEVIMETGHGKKSDIWSIGCTVFEMATRKPPWAEMPPMTAIFAIGTGGPVPQLPEKFSCFAREFVNTCLTRDQDERPTATQLLTHSFIRKRRERGRDRFETRISSSTMEDANITFKEHVGSEDVRHEIGRRQWRRDEFS